MSYSGGYGGYGGGGGTAGGFGGGSSGTGRYGGGGAYSSSYSSSYNSAPSYSSGIWGGANAVFPPLPTSQPGPPGTSSLYPRTPSARPSSGPSQPPKKPAFKLRRSIHPRAPLTILNELAGGKVQFEFLDVPEEERRRRAWQADTDVEEVGSFECRCIVQGLEFIAEGVTKGEAKTAVVEISIQGMISAKCQKNEDEGVGVNEDNCPWTIIASLALYKLYNSWQSQGYTLPPELTTMPGEGVAWGNSRGGGGQHQQASMVGGGGETKIKVDRVNMDKPALQLVNEMASRMKMSLDFELTSEVGTPNDKIFTMTVKVGENTYSGQGKNKKSAKQAAATAVLEAQDTWYSPPVRASTPPGLEEEEEQEPPVKRRTLINQEDMASLLCGDGTPSEDKVAETENTEDMEDTPGGPEDRGLQPGSHPSNVQ